MCDPHDFHAAKYRREGWIVKSKCRTCGMDRRESLVYDRKGRAEQAIKRMTGGEGGDSGDTA